MERHRCLLQLDVAMVRWPRLAALAAPVTADAGLMAAGDGRGRRLEGADSPLIPKHRRHPRSLRASGPAPTARISLPIGRPTIIRDADMLTSRYGLSGRLFALLGSRHVVVAVSLTHAGRPTPPRLTPLISRRCADERRERGRTRAVRRARCEAKRRDKDIPTRAMTAASWSGCRRCQITARVMIANADLIRGRGQGQEADDARRNQARSPKLELTSCSPARHGTARRRST